MRVEVPRLITSDDISMAWAAAFLHASKGPRPAPLVVSIGFPSSKRQAEGRIRTALDQALASAGETATEDTAETIFPYSTWIRRGRPTRKVFFARYIRMLPRIRARSPAKHDSTYFGRMIDFRGVAKSTEKGIDQLSKILDVWDRQEKRSAGLRASALQLACFNPLIDHTGQPRQGFPCLQQVGLSYDRDTRSLSINAFYPAQYIFGRAYGNYLGLSYLGEFLAHEMHLNLTRLTCFITAPQLASGISKSSLRPLIDLVQQVCAESAYVAS